MCTRAQEDYGNRSCQYRTGRNVQLNLKLRREAVDAFYRIADAQGCLATPSSTPSPL
jgi:hypothetical protein